MGNTWKPNFNEVNFFNRVHLEKYLSICTAAVEIQEHIEQKPSGKDEYGNAIININ